MLKISTIKNGKTIHSNFVNQMIFSPEFLISFHSEVFTFEPCDIISTGTPGAVQISAGDKVSSMIEGVDCPILENNVT
jgi:2-keto-4-pentenoate hydratase/2-oxohepta-3-ene-1,7-dioic acid hydratase in catechol pathway